MINKVEDFRYITEKFKLPVNEENNKENSLIALCIKNKTESLSILKNNIIKPSFDYTKYFVLKTYKKKIFINKIDIHHKQNELDELKDYLKQVHLSATYNENDIKTKNVIVDLSDYNTFFLEAATIRNYNAISTMYINELANYLGKIKLRHKDRYIIINVSNWGINRTNKTENISSMSKLLNPISMFYYLMKKEFSLFKQLDDYTVIVLDGEVGWFKFNLANINQDSYVKFNSAIKKIKSAEFPTEAEDVDLVDNEEDEEPISVNKDELEDNESSLDDMDLELIKMAESELNDNYQTVTRSITRNKRIEEIRKKQKDIKIKNMSLSDAKKLHEKNYTIEEVDLSDKIFCPNKNLKKVKFDNFNKSYNQNVMEKDITNVFKSLSNRKLPVYIVGDIEKEDTSTSMDLKYTYHVTLESEDGLRHNITIDVPKVYDNNYMFIGGNRKQFTNQLFANPINKIAPNTVQFCTNYNKVFMYRYGEIISPKVTVFKKIVLNNPKYFKVRRGNGTGLSKGKKTSIEYDNVSRDFISIEIRGKDIELNFDQHMYDKMIEEKHIKPIGDDYIYCIYNKAEKNKDLIAIPISVESEFNNKEDDIAPKESSENISKGSPIDIFVYYFNKSTGLDFWKLGGPKDKAGKRFMYTYCKIMNKKIPTILLLAYFEGLSTVMNKANIRYHFSDKRIQISQDDGIIQFADGYLIYSRNPTSNGLLMNGLNLIDSKAYTFEEMNNPSTYLNIFNTLYSSRILASGLDAYYDNLLDPITIEILEDMDLPTDVVSFILVGNTMLADNSYDGEISLKNYRFRHMEMISSHLYKLLANAYSTYRRNASSKNPTKISIPKGELIKNIVTSNNVEDYSIINPIIELKKAHLTGWKGPSGTNLERAYTKKRRCYDDTMTGMLSLTTSSEASCGITREATVEPKVINTRGYIDTEKNVDDMNEENLFSYAELLTPKTVTNDDSIRTSMAVKQSGHLLPVKDMSPVLVSNGLEKRLPYVISKDYAIRAKEDGIIDKIDEKANLAIVKYKSGECEAINLDSVIVKNGGGGFYLPNKMKLNFKQGQKVKKGDIIAQNDTFFKNGYDGCKYSIGTLCKTAIMSSFATFEDSKLITKSLSKRMTAEMIMNKHVILGAHSNVSYIIKKGDHVSVGEPLIIYEQSNAEEAVNQLLKNIGDDLREDIKSIGKNSLNSKYTGVIEDIRIYSTYELDELSESLRKIVSDYWKSISAKKKLVKSYNITEAEDSGNTFYLNDGVTKPDDKDRVKGYKVESGGVIIEFYIKFTDPVGVGDKLCDFAALKGVTCAIIPEGEEPYAIDSPDEEISTILPASSILARMTPSIIQTMFANKLLINLKRKLKEIYNS